MRLSDGCDERGTLDGERPCRSGGGVVGPPRVQGARGIEVPAEVGIRVETTAGVMGCSAREVREEAHDRMPVEIRGLACFGRPARLVWNKRRWRCRTASRGVVGFEV